MDQRPKKTFDRVDSMRQIRDQISNEIQHMDQAQIVRWLRSRPLSDAHLKRLAETVRESENSRDTSQ